MKTNEHNELLNQVKGLTWLPWVGSDYSDIKLLLIGESHYAQHENGDEDLDCYNYFLTDNNATISFVEDVIDGSTWSFFRNTHYALTGNDNVDRETFWKNVAYYNFIQRPMKTRCDRPLTDDFKRGWEVFFEILLILKPTHCIFLGSGGAKYLWSEKDKKKEEYDFVEDKCYIDQWDRKIGNNYGKIAHLAYNDVCTDITFIRHPSSYFSKELWHAYLMEKAKYVLVKLQHKTNL